MRAKHPPRVHKILGPIGRSLGRIPHPTIRSKGGLFVLFILVAGFGAVLTVGGVLAVQYSETSSFCGRCHTMSPELKAFAMSPHKELTCAECHVEPGIGGWVKAKTKGTKQLFEIITGKFPTPIPPPDHAELPAVTDTCLRCHSLDRITKNGGPVKLIMRPKYQLDEANTREMVSVVLRPGDVGDAGGVRGVHWHVQQEVSYSTSDIRSRKIDLVEINFKDGATRQYLSSSQVGVSNNVIPDIERLKKSGFIRRMDCIDCHNRIGHGIPSPDQAVDEAIAAGRISAGLPYIKRDGLALLNGDYPSLAAADQAIDGLRASYAARYPLVLKIGDLQVTAAIDRLKQIYRLIATPDMKVQAQTYPNNLGHQASPGCFRCHDGAHFRVVQGKITTETIPSACATCHTFPQIGTNVSELLLGAKPADHKDSLYVFNHKNAVTKVEPTGTTCGACHTRSYCENCHKSGAIKVTHTAMLYSHASAITTAGGTQACAACHQPVYCARCHQSPVLQPRAPPLAGKLRQQP